MSNHDDFVDDYIEYRIFEESMKRSGGGKPPKRTNGGCGCGTWAILIVAILIVLSVLGSCSKSSKSTYSGLYRSKYSSSYSNYSNSSSRSSGSRNISSDYSFGSSSSRSAGTYSVYSSASKTKSSSKSKSTSSDPYDAKSYAHPDDLYYDYPDEFWDYEDAEDYYNKHISD